MIRRSEVGWESAVVYGLVAVDSLFVRICCFLACGLELLEGFGDDACPALESEEINTAVVESPHT